MKTRAHIRIALGLLCVLCPALTASGQGQGQPATPPAPPPKTTPPDPKPDEKRDEKPKEPDPVKPAPAQPVAPAKETKPPSPAPDVPAPPASDVGPEVVVYLKDGKSLTGLLVRENSEELVIRISGIETPIETRSIDRYQILEPILERYRKFREGIGDNPDQILLLVSWLQAREQFELAIYELDRLLKTDPHNKQALALKRAVQSQIDLRDATRSRVKGQAPHPGPAIRHEENDPEAHEPFPLLSEAQVNLIKVFEIDMDHPPRVVIPRDTITKLLQTYAGSPLLPATEEGRDAIYRKSPLEVLDLMFRLRARELYGEVEVLDQPRSMRLFRDDVQAGWLVNSCATSGCHGGTEAGRLMLLNRKARSEVSAYTNFLILERFRLNDGTPLLNYDDPANSPLLQMALPRADSTRKHPAVPRGPRGNDVWKPLFRNAQERGFERTVEWLKTMYRPRPEYPIEYRPPRPSEPPVREKREPSPR